VVDCVDAGNCIKAGFRKRELLGRVNNPKFSSPAQASLDCK
jgi:hypothetical protein